MKESKSKYLKISGLVTIVNYALVKLSSRLPEPVTLDDKDIAILSTPIAMFIAWLFILTHMFINYLIKDKFSLYRLERRLRTEEAKLGELMNRLGVDNRAVMDTEQSINNLRASINIIKEARNAKLVRDHNTHINESGLEIDLSEKSKKP